MNHADWNKYQGLSEEAIAAELLKNWVEPPPLQNREVSFIHLMEGAAQDVDNIKAMLVAGTKLPLTPPDCAITPAEASKLAQELRRVGVEKANAKKVSDQDLQACRDEIGRAHV